MHLRAAIVSIMLSAAVSAVEIIAHRGASHDAPENTMPAFRLAWERKADAVELDVHLTRDGRIVVIHDATTKRTCGPDRKVAGQTLAQLKQLDAGSWKGPQWKNTRIPTLEEVLAAVPESKRVFIEIKCGPEILPELARIIGTTPCKPGQLVVIGFNFETVKRAKALLPRIEVQWIVKPEKRSGGMKPSVTELIANARFAKLDGLDLESGFPIDNAFVGKVHAAKLKLGVWTVDDPAMMERLKAAGVDGITTNRPEIMNGGEAETPE